MLSRSYWKRGQAYCTERNTFRESTIRSVRAGTAALRRPDLGYDKFLAHLQEVEKAHVSHPDEPPILLRPRSGRRSPSGGRNGCRWTWCGTTRPKTKSAGRSRSRQRWSFSISHSAPRARFACWRPAGKSLGFRLACAAASEYARVNRPVPAPMSATVWPAFRWHPATIFLRRAKTLRLSTSTARQRRF